MKLGIIFSVIIPVSVLVGTGKSDSKKLVKYQPTCESLPQKNYMTPPDSRTNWDGDIKSISGLVYWNNSYWGVADQHNKKLYQIPVSGNKTPLEITIDVEDDDRYDWEEITQDNTFFYIAATGNNSLHITENVYRKKIIRIKKTNTLNSNTLKPEVLKFYYSNPDGDRIDCEAVFVSAGNIHLITKGINNTKTFHYMIPVSAFNNIKSDVQATLIENLDPICDMLITGAAINNNNNNVVLIGYGNFKDQNGKTRNCNEIKCMMFSFILNNKNYKLENRSGYKLGFEDTLGQIESVCFDKKNRVVILNEYGDVDCKKTNTFLIY